MSTSENTSRAGQVVTVLGGSGFFGKHLAQELLSRGYRLRIASRHPERAYRLKTLGNLGQVQFARCDVTKPETLAAVLTGSDAVVNLVGGFNGDLDALQGKGAGLIAEAARTAGAGSFLHISAIGADEESRVDYARTKAEGEEAVRAAFPGATVLRAPILFGPDDHFVAMFASLVQTFPVLPVFGPQAKLQPAFIDDVAEGAAVMLTGPDMHGRKIYELAGPEIMTMLEFNQRIANAQGRNRLFVELPDAISGAIAMLTGWLPGASLTNDSWNLLKLGNVASGNHPGFKALGIAPRPLGLFLDRWMVRYRSHGRFGRDPRTT
ncbi:MAG: complex I NDUFA9 subunit family protein [Novosphingobium sp.]|nr:complex I NDUFA9 subunit family protein [Novosphingobium sp.]